MIIIISISGLVLIKGKLNKLKDKIKAGFSKDSENEEINNSDTGLSEAPNSGIFEAPADRSPVEAPAEKSPVEAPADRSPVEGPADRSPVEVPGDRSPVEVPAEKSPVEVPADKPTIKAPLTEDTSESLSKLPQSGTKSTFNPSLDSNNSAPQLPKSGT